MKILVIRVISLAMLLTSLDAKPCNSKCHGPTSTEIKAYIQSLSGTTVNPHDAAYATSCLLYNRRFTAHPGLIVYALDAGDVQKTVRFANKHSLKMAIRSTGHSFVGRSTIDGGLVLDLSMMKAISVQLNSTRSPDGEVTVESGNTWKRVYKTVDKYGRVVVGGSDSSVGMGGYTQGGGHSPITRTFGLAVDNLVEATLVTAAGKIVTVSASGTTIHEDDGTVKESTDSDLFWAIRGGGGGTWGVVLTFTFKLHQPPINGMIQAVAIYPMYTTTGTPGVAVLKKFYEYCKTLDTHYGGYATFNDAVINATSFGNLLLMLVHYGGWTPQIQTKLEQFIIYAGVEPKVKYMVNKTSFWDYEKDIPADHGGSRIYTYNALLQNDTDYGVMVDTLVKQSSQVMYAVQGCADTFIGGAMTKFGTGDTSISPYFRTATHSLTCYLGWSDPKLDDKASKKALEFGNQLKKFGKAIYFNEPTQDVMDWKEESWGKDNYARLLTIKNKWDPENLFSCKHCVGSDIHTKEYCPICVNDGTSIVG